MRVIQTELDKHGLQASLPPSVRTQRRGGPGSVRDAIRGINDFDVPGPPRCVQTRQSVHAADPSRPRSLFLDVCGFVRRSGIHSRVKGATRPLCESVYSIGHLSLEQGLE